MRRARRRPALRRGGGHRMLQVRAVHGRHVRVQARLLHFQAGLAALEVPQQGQRVGQAWHVAGGQRGGGKAKRCGRSSGCRCFEDPVRHLVVWAPEAAAAAHAAPHRGMQGTCLPACVPACACAERPGCLQQARHRRSPAMGVPARMTASAMSSAALPPPAGPQSRGSASSCCRPRRSCSSMALLTGVLQMEDRVCRGLACASTRCTSLVVSSRRCSRSVSVCLDSASVSGEAT